MNLRFSTLAAVVALTTAAPIFAQTNASARAEAYDNAVLGVMKQNAPLAARIAHFSAIVTTYYDVPAIAATVAGSAWASAPATDRQALIAALTRHSAIQLAKNFDKYSGEQFVIDPAAPQARGDSTIVKVTIQSKGDKKDVLYYRMRGAKIFDVTSGGVSQLAVQRSDVASTASTGGVAAVVKRLREVDAKYN